MDVFRETALRVRLQDKRHPGKVLLFKGKRKAAYLFLFAMYYK